MVAEASGVPIPDGFEGLEARMALSRLATMRPATTPEEARSMAIAMASLYGAELDAMEAQVPEQASFQGALAQVLGKDLPAMVAGSHAGAQALSARDAGDPEEPAILDFRQALAPLAEAPADVHGVEQPGEAQAVALPLAPGTVPDRCPGDLQPRVLAPGELMSPACWNEHGTMVWVPGRRSRWGFLVDWTEVSVADYAACVAAGACEAPGRHPGCYGTELAKGSYPVNCVDRAQAEAWCAWAGRRLCTGDEHQRAARGPGDGIYPWGDAPPSCTRVVMDGRGQQGPSGAPGCGSGGPWPVGSLPDGVSACGALDLSGNVAEWVAGQPGGVAGGGYMDKAPEELQGRSLRHLPADLPVPDVGFRCCLE